MKINHVFVSSVMRGYEDRREAARQAVSDAGMIPIMAEELMAETGSPREVVLVESILECDAVVGIYGNRYGWTGTRSGISPTEEEYDRSRELWKPIYGFIDRMQSNQMEAMQQKFLHKAQHWDTGITRNEFRSLSVLKQKINDALTNIDLSPRYRTLLSQIRLNARREGYEEVMETRLPAFDTLLYKKASDVHFTFDPEKVIAVLNGDGYTPQQLEHISKLWQTTLHDYFGPSIWNQTGIEGFLVVAVEQNPFQITPDILPRERSGKAGGYYGVVANLIASQIAHPKLRLKDRGVKTLLIEPILQPALATI